MGWSQNYWTDSRLTWDPEEWDGIDKLRLPSSELWVPDVTLYNSNGKVESNYLGWEDTTRVVLKSSGLVVFIPPVTYRASCPAAADASGDPTWAEQNCTLKFGSWVYGFSQVDVKPRTSASQPSAFDFSKLFDDSRIEVLSSSVTKVDKKYPCCPHEVYPRLDFQVAFKRTAAVRDGKIVDANGEKDEE